MSLKINIEMKTTIGLPIPAGALLTYKHIVAPDQKSFMTEYQVYAGEEAYKKQENAIPADYIKNFVVNGQVAGYAVTKIDVENSTPSAFETWPQLFDGMAARALLSITEGITADNIELVGLVEQYPNGKEPATV